MQVYNLKVWCLFRSMFINQAFEQARKLLLKNERWIANRCYDGILTTEEGNALRKAGGQGIKGAIRNAAGLCKLLNSSMPFPNSPAAFGSWWVVVQTSSGLRILLWRDNCWRFRRFLPNIWKLNFCTDYIWKLLSWLSSTWCFNPGLEVKRENPRW